VAVEAQSKSVQPRKILNGWAMVLGRGYLNGDFYLFDMNRSA
jgi:hypothetical protein